MSLKFRNSQGIETPVAGLNGTSGELVPSVALQQSGTATISMLSTSELTDLFTKTVTFDTPFDDTDYVLNVDQCEVSEAEINRVYDKTTTGFTVAVMYNRKLTKVPSYDVTARIPWTAFKLMTNTVHEADAAHIAQNNANFAPAFSDSVSYAVGDYVTYNNVLYRCTTAHTAGTWVAGHFTQVTVGGDLGNIVSNAYNPSSYGGYTTGTKTWWKISNLFVAGSDFTYRTNVFLLSSREGSGTALLVIGDNGSNIRSAQIIMLNGTLNGVTDFYFDAGTSSLYYSMQWSRLQIVQLSGQKIDIGEATQSSSSEAAQYTAITPSTLASIDNANALIRMRRICLTEADSVIQIARAVYFNISTSSIAKMEMKAIKSDGSLLWNGYVTATGAHGSMVITNTKWAGSSSAVTFNEWGTPAFANDEVAAIFELTNLSL